MKNDVKKDYEYKKLNSLTGRDIREILIDVLDESDQLQMNATGSLGCASQLSDISVFIERISEDIEDLRRRVESISDTETLNVYHTNT